MYSTHLFNVVKLKAIAGDADDAAEACTTITDALSMYEQADELTGQERVDARESAREEAWAAMGDLLVAADKIRIARDKLADEE